jgi:uncharacterized protein (TIGR04255 family)
LRREASNAHGVDLVTERVHYSKAPITEALIDLRIAHAQGVSVKDLESMGELIADSYPSQDPLYLYSGQIAFQQPGDPARVQNSHQHGGFIFTSQNKQHVLRARIDGFTFSTLAPYDRWESFRDEARRLWDVYCSAVSPEGVTRVAMRYINEIDIAAVVSDPTNFELREVLNVYPEAPDAWTLQNFFVQLQMRQEDLGCWTVVNEAPVWHSDKGIALLQLDLDLFKDISEEPWSAENDVAVWDYLEQLHIRKNEVFEASITDRIREAIR